MQNINHKQIKITMRKIKIIMEVDETVKIIPRKRYLEMENENIILYEL